MSSFAYLISSSITFPFTIPDLNQTFNIRFGKYDGTRTTPNHLAPSRL